MRTISPAKAYAIRRSLLSVYSRTAAALRHRRYLTPDEVTSVSDAILYTTRFNLPDIRLALLSLFKPSDTGTLYSRPKLSTAQSVTAFSSLFAEAPATLRRN